ncbi:GNAT family N-acetyltransferase [Amylibacter sp.]|nr:GNAT family N-acetyltransferase [Amylibacter sp.]MDA7846769.1 GNAT family N-acetyltransferase [Amylibacter sp.]MDA9253486.1 GNAT family N-acetyltransferase [Amylibacter sp.]MDA9788486.1 GNAT family N-acetyltransferase [Amylibacter sp.]MDB0001008.1 GNAT family N-acetyltransferase [Amylibacter sp.]|tara:strand:- start:1704 stop:2303 length:600 start_codon:yes stop_codon:yes gene_type:complete
MKHWPEDITLLGDYVRIDPLSVNHLNDLQDVVRDGELNLLWYTFIPNADDMLEEINKRLRLREMGSMQPFAIIDIATGLAIGMTTFMNIDATNRRVEIGSTWLSKSTQRTFINTESKLLLMAHAFEKLNCIAVEFRTHFINTQSRKAIERLGAKFDGILRNHSIMPNGTLRDTAVYSIIKSEWPTVKSHLNFQLSKKRD